MALIVGTNSYVDVAYADAFLADRLWVDAWSDATVDDKPKVLIMATRKLDSLILRGVKKNIDQALAFPRCYEDDGTDRRTDREVFGSAGLLFEAAGRYSGLYCEAETPDAVKEATVLEALSILATKGQSTRAELQAQGVASYSIGRLSETFVDGARPQQLASKEARDLLARYVARSFDAR